MQTTSPKPFNVTLMHPPGFIHSLAAEPFRESVFFTGRASLIEDIVTLYRDRAAFDARSRSMLAEFKKRDPLPSMASAIERFLYRRPLAS